MKNHIQTRIILAFSLLLLAIQTSTIVIINTVYSASTDQNIRQNLHRGERIFSLLLENNSRQLIQSAGIMSSDFAFRKSIALADLDTIISVLNNHGSRVSADVLLLSGLEGELVASTLATESVVGINFAELLGVAEREGRANTLAILNGQLHQIVVVPVLGPLPIAWLAAGFRIDDSFAANLQSVAGIEVTFLGRERDVSSWKTLASSLAGNISPGLSDLVSDSPGRQQPADGIHALPVGDDTFQSLIVAFEGNGNTEINAVLQQSLQQALAPLRELQRLLLVLGVLSLVAVLFSSYLIARGISRPIVNLSQLANRIRRGDYSQSAPALRSDEIGDLASAFNHMKADIADRETRISQLAYQDQLTLLPNRVAFRQKLEQFVASGEQAETSAALLLINLDRMNDVNAILGHSIGDLFLQEVSRRLGNSLPTEALALARLGGDEFALLMTPCDKAVAIDTAENIRNVLNQPLVLEDQEILPTGSIGIALYPEHGRQSEELLRRADIAMYRAKAESSGFEFFEPSLEATSKNLSLMAQMRHAIRRNEFELFYQPKLSLADFEVKEVEALIRWNHPERGQVQPGEFITHAEQTGYIRNITGWIIEAAIKQCQAWREKNCPLRISINISARDLTNEELPALFARLLAKYGATPDCLGLEITESAIMDDPKRSLGILESLNGMGLKLSVDDFGTGYSSLAYLKQLPVSELKIDQSFIYRLTEEQADKAIVTSTIALGHAMGLTVVAEGVENGRTQDTLKQMGCDITQGYFIGKPMSAEQIIPWLEQRPWKSAAP